MKPSVFLAAFLLFASGARADDGIFSLKTASKDLAAVVEKYRGEFQTGGYRFDDDTGRLISPATHGAATTEEVELYISKIKLARAHSALEKIRELLKGVDPDKPVPPEILEQIKTIIRDTPGFPEDAAKVLAGAHVDNAGALRAETLASFLEQTRFVEADLGWRGTAAATPRLEGGGWARPPAVKAYQTDDERALGERISRAAEEHFTKYKTGNELLDHFRDEHGSLHLPDMLVLKVQEYSGAVYSAGDRAMIFNFPSVRYAIIQHAPPDKQAELEKKLKSVKDLNEYLAKDSGAIEDFISAYDVGIYHELTHAWQDKRQRLWSEMMRGNVPGFDPLECEWEAFINQNRFTHEKLLKDPVAAMKGMHFSYYQSMIANYDQFQDGITRQYLGMMPGSAATLPEMRSIQEDNVAAAETSMRASVAAYVRGAMRIIGLAHGSVAMTEAQSDFQRRRDDFKKNELPRMRAEGGLALAQVYEKQGDWSKALVTINPADLGADAAPDRKAEITAAAARMAAKAYDMLKLGKGDAEERAMAANILWARSTRVAASPRISPDMRARAYLDVANEYLKRAEHAEHPDTARQITSSAKAWVDALGDLKPEDLTDPALRERLKAMRFETARPAP